MLYAHASCVQRSIARSFPNNRQHKPTFSRLHPWYAALCLQMLASKLGQASSTLLLGAADAVIAHMLWFSLDSLEGFTQFVESVMHPETFIAVVTVSFCCASVLSRRTILTSTYIYCNVRYHTSEGCVMQDTLLDVLLLQVCGRKIVRRVVQLAGLPCFWDGQYQPPPSLLQRAKEYVGILASIMELPQPASTIELLQGEPIALLLKSIGNALSKSEPAGAAPPQRQQPPQEAQQQGRQRKAAGKAGPAGTDSLLLSGVAAEKLQSLRALVVLMNLLGEHLGTHALQVRISLDLFERHFMQHFTAAFRCRERRPGMVSSGPGSRVY